MTKNFFLAKLKKFFTIVTRRKKLEIESFFFFGENGETRVEFLFFRVIIAKKQKLI